MKGNTIQLFEELYRKHATAIFRFVFIRVSDRATAQDITAETFLHLLKIIKKQTRIENPKALLYFIARGLIVDYYRKNKKTLPIEVAENQTDLSQADLDKQMDEKQELAIIYAKVKRLKHEYQEVILLRFVEDLTIPEIASVIQKKENAVRVLLHRALQSLKKKL